MGRVHLLSVAVVMVLVVGVTSGVSAAPAANVPTGSTPPSACLVWTQGGVVECFSSVGQLKTTETQLRRRLTGSSGAVGGVSPNTSCYSDLQLFSGPSFTGSEVDIWDVGIWVNLSNFGFANRTVSFSNGGCQSYLAKGPNGSVAWYPNSGPWVAVANMGLYWNDTIESVYIS
jgi:hypothetical protein